MRANHQSLNRYPHFSLDVLCRVLVSDYRDIMHAMDVFMEENRHLLEPCQAISSVSDELVHGAKLTSAALGVWDRLEEDQKSRLEQDNRRLLDYVAGH